MLGGRQVSNVDKFKTNVHHVHHYFVDINDEFDQVNQIDDEGLTEMTVNINEQKPEAVYLRRYKITKYFFGFSIQLFKE